MRTVIVILGMCAIFFELARADQQQEDVFLQHIGTAFQRMNQLLTDHNLPLLAFDHKQIKITQQFDRQRKFNVWNLEFSNGMQVQCLPKEYDIILFARDTMSKDDPLYDHEPKPVWTSDHAIAEAKVWATALFGNFPVNTGAPIASYGVTVMQYPKYYDGQWNITWPRTDSKGHLFGTDSIGVVLSEKKGPIAIAQNFTSKFEEQQGGAIPRATAIQISHTPAAILLHSDMAKSWLPPGLSLGSVISSELWVVNPNHILEHKTIGEAVQSTDLKARLAWRILYSLTTETSKATRGDLEIWIDAYTSEVLGGNFK